uniref:zinc finger BED domain-containing protein 4-like n=1 Tax=Styela clava TaxID=7725 RepID=UPI001939731D|nr:zinc finger BED domain-containing protein 4-like [Styela clava]
MSRRSNVWQHFSLPVQSNSGKSETECKWCHEKFAFHGTTSNLSNHMKRKHPGIKLEEEQLSRGTSSSAKQTRLEHFRPISQARQEEITCLITEFVVADMRPLSVVDGVGFRNLLKNLQPSYAMPSRQTIARRVETMFAGKKLFLKKKGCLMFLMHLLKNAQTIAPKTSDWELFRQIKPLLKPFADATDILGGQGYTSLSSKYPIIKGLKKHLIIDRDEGCWMKEFRKKVKGALELDLAKILQKHSPTHSEAAAPSIQSSPQLSPVGKILKLAFDSSESDSSTDTDPVSMGDEINKYFSLKVVADNKDPLIWWKENENLFPNLVKLVQEYLGIPATSMPSERVFSVAGNTATELKSSLTGFHVEALVFLKANKNLWISK